MGLAHRYSYGQFVHGLPPREGQVGAGGVIVMHSCDNPPCVNPAHLSAGSQFDNMRDAVSRGRMRDRKGEQNGRAKLDVAAVVAIRASVTGRHGERMAIARQYGISSGQVSKILNGDSWGAVA